MEKLYSVKCYRLNIYFHLNDNIFEFFGIMVHVAPPLLRILLSVFFLNIYKKQKKTLTHSKIKIDSLCFSDGSKMLFFKAKSDGPKNKRKEKQV